MSKIRFMKWVAIATTGSFFLWGAGGCLPEDFWPGFVGDTIVTGVGSALLAAGLAAAGV